MLLLITGLTIGLLSFFIEIVIGTQVKSIREAARNYWLINISMSILLTWTFSLLFSAGGMTVLLAALTSITLSSIYYRTSFLLHKVRRYRK